MSDEIKTNIITATELNNLIPWDVAAVIHRTNPLPLDSTSYFTSYADAEKYAKGEFVNKFQNGATAYVGQIITVVENKGSEDVPNYDIAIYQIGIAGELVKIQTGDIELSNYCTIEQFDEVSANVTKAINSIESINTLFGDLSDDISNFTELQQSIDDLHGIHSKDISEINNKIDGVYTEISTYADELSAVQDNISNIAETTNTHTNEILNINNLLSSLEEQPTITNPSITVSVDKTTVEVGTPGNFTITSAFNKGKYSFGPTDTSVSVISSTIKLDGNDLTSNEYPISALSSGSHTITISVEHDEGVFAKTNLGRETSKKINKNTITDSCTIASNYGVFYTYKNNADKINIDEITSDIIRTFTKNLNYPTAINITTDEMKQIIVAVPTAKYSNVSVKSTTLGIHQIIYNKNDVIVKDAGGNDVNYTVFYVENKAADGTENDYRITLTKK